METVTAQPLATSSHEPNGKLSQTAADSTTNADKTKRKSVSFVDEKLIMDALNSTSVSNGKPNGSSIRYKPTNQEVRLQQQNRAAAAANGAAKHHANGRAGAGANGAKTAPGQQQQRYSNGHSRGSHKAVNGATSNPVIVYYNDPQAQFDVDQLLTKQPPSGQVNKRHPASVLAPKSTNGHHKQNGGGHKGPSEQHHPSRYEDNWRQNGQSGKGVSSPSKHESNSHRPVNGHNGHNNGTGGVKSNGKPNYQPRTPSGKTNGHSEKVTPKSEPITIYYSTPTSSEVIEQNLKELQLKTNGAESAKSTGEPCAANGSNDWPVDKKPAVAAAVPVPASAEQPTEPSQVNVINEPQMMEVQHEAPSLGPPPPPVLVGGGDEYDVISGGVPIEGPTLPAEEGRRPRVLCTLVSHPGHFYVKFVSAQCESQLASLNQFYHSDEHIDLSVDVLKAGQYFAAARTRPSDQTREWIRVQLLHVETPELINCLLIDEGCFGMFKLSDLQPLYNQFRSVPKQAIRASLAGVKPKESDWLPKQALEFKNLVADQKFHTGEQKFDQKTFDEKQTLEIELYFTEEAGEEFKDKSVADIVVERDIASKK